ncbi:MAG: deoxyribodipyrimidine photo-lyase [Hyphomicrobiales bacterium]|nr:deoxyribodipyrimidine photo-lyase [Hyphomicrobiales bacterium]
MSRPHLLWLRRDLRLGDHPALEAAAAPGAPVIPVFVHDPGLGGTWALGAASRWWLDGSLRALDAALRARGSRLVLRSGLAVDTLRALARETKASAVYFTRGYEPFIKPVEIALRDALAEDGVECRRFGGHILNEPEDVMNKSGEPFKVFTPYYKTVLARGEPRAPKPAPETLAAPKTWPKSENLDSWGFQPTKPDWAGGMRAAWTPGEAGAHARLQEFTTAIMRGYGESRNMPGQDGTSRLSPHLAFGEISPHQVWMAVSAAAETAGASGGAESYLREIVWREFSYQLLFHNPRLPDQAFRPEFAPFPFVEDSAGLRAWRRGRTGYPIVDAGMRQLWQTGWMHNRVRMIVASFLIKHLLIDWREGERWFWDTLVDADLANNSSSWQWVAGSGADAAPYFRIFNPVLQGEKFDAEGGYIRRFVPELAGLAPEHIHAPWNAPPAALAKAGVRLGRTYPAPIVDHAKARARALAAYEKIKQA